MLSSARSSSSLWLNPATAIEMRNVSLPSALDPALAELLFDPQTSGGLLLSVAGDKTEALLSALAASGVAAFVVGSVAASGGSYVEVICAAED